MGATDALTETNFLISYNRTKKEFSLCATGKNIDLKNCSFFLVDYTDGNLKLKTKKIETVDNDSTKPLNMQNVDRPILGFICEHNSEKTIKNVLSSIISQSQQSLDYIKSEKIGAFNTSQEKKDFLSFISKIYQHLSNKKRDNEENNESKEAEVDAPEEITTPKHKFTLEDIVHSEQGADIIRKLADHLSEEIAPEMVPIIDAMLRIINHFSDEKNTSGSIALLQFSFDHQITKLIRVIDFKDIVSYKENINPLLNAKIIELEKIKTEIETNYKFNTAIDIQGRVYNPKLDFLPQVKERIKELEAYKKDKFSSIKANKKTPEEIETLFSSVEKEYILIKTKIQEIKDEKEVLEKIKNLINNYLLKLNSVLDTKINPLLAKKIEDKKKDLKNLLENVNSLSNEDLDKIEKEQSRYLENLEIIKKTLDKIDALEGRITSNLSSLQGSAIKLFMQENFMATLNEIKEKSKELVTAEEPDFALKSEEINKSFEIFEENYKRQIHSIQEISEQFKRHQSETNTKIDLITKNIEEHIEKLKGNQPISLLDRFINFIFKSTTKKKLKVESYVCETFTEIKEYINNFSDSENKENLNDCYTDLDKYFKDKSISKRRSFLFFSSKLPRSQVLFNEAAQLVDELKTQFKA